MPSCIRKGTEIMFFMLRMTPNHNMFFSILFIKFVFRDFYIVSWLSPYCYLFLPLFFYRIKHLMPQLESEAGTEKWVDILFFPSSFSSSSRFSIFFYTLCLFWVARMWCIPILFLFLQLKHFYQHSSERIVPDLLLYKVLSSSQFNFELFYLAHRTKRECTSKESFLGRYRTEITWIDQKDHYRLIWILYLFWNLGNLSAESYCEWTL